MGDGGLAFGAACLSYYSKNQYKPEISKADTMYLGNEYTDEQILNILQKQKNITYKKIDELSKETAKLIVNRKIIGWFQGRMEFGPRALGSRSVLAMPDDPTINKWLNDRMQRTEFMPFAPSVLSEHMDDIFEIKSEKFKRPAEYMTITYNVREKWRKKIGAVNHVDNTARPQIVYKKSNPLFYSLIEEVHRLTKLPMVINTSFNVHEEPIVMTPEDALESLKIGMIDILIIGNFLVEKN